MKKAPVISRSLKQTLNGIKLQVSDSLQYCKDRFSGYRDPEDLFYYLRSVTSYQPDPPGVELLQSAQTLFENNRHGIPGAGDCDCFTILALAALKVNKFGPRHIVLAGNEFSHPVHICAAVTRDVIPFDLTYHLYAGARKYRYHQVLLT